MENNTPNWAEQASTSATIDSAPDWASAAASTNIPSSDKGWAEQASGAITSTSDTTDAHRYDASTLEKYVPVVGHIIGAAEALVVDPAIQIFGKGITDVGKALGLGDDASGETQQQILSNSLINPHTATGKYIQDKIGQVFSYYDSLNKPTAETMIGAAGGESLPAPVQGVIGAAAEFTGQILPYILPYAPKYFKKALSKVQDGTVLIDHDTFLDQYKKENPKATSNDAKYAYADFSNKLIQNSYKLISDSKSMDRTPEPRDVVQKDYIDPLTSATQKINDAKLTKFIQGKEDWTPLTLTRAEFGELIKKKNIQTKIDDLVATRSVLQDTLQNTADPKKIEQLKSKIGELKNVLVELKNKADNPTTENAIDLMYSKYVNVRASDTSGPVPMINTAIEKAFQLREQESSVLKHLQEEHAWQQLELMTGSNKFTNMARIVSLPLDQGIRARDIVNSQASKIKGISPLPTYPTPFLDSMYKDASKTFDLIRENNRATIDDSIVGKSIPKETVEEVKTNTLVKEMQGVFKPGMSRTTFTKAVQEKYGVMPEPLAKALFDKLPKPNKYEDNGSGNFIQRLSTKERGMGGDALEMAGAKAISMWFAKATKSPTAKKLLSMIYRPEIQTYTKGEYRIEIPIAVAQRQMHYKFAQEWQNIIDELQLSEGKGLFTGFKSLVPQKLGGWGAASLPKKINQKLWYAAQGEPLKGTSDGILRAAQKYRTLEDRMFDYLKGSGLDVEYLNNHSARMWDRSKISKDPEAFSQMLRRRNYKEANIDEIIRTLSQNDGMVEIPVRNGKIYGQTFEGDKRFNRLAKNAELSRKLQNIPLHEAEPFLNTNLHFVINKYIEQITRRAEFARKFGPNQEVLDTMIPQIQKELEAVGDSLTMQEVRRIYNIIDAKQGMYNIDKMGKLTRNITGWSVSLGAFAQLQLSVLASLQEIAAPFYAGSAKAWVKAVPKSLWSLTKEWTRFNVYKGFSKTELEQFRERINMGSEAMAAERIMSMHSGTNASLDTFTFAANVMHSWSKLCHYVAISTFKDTVEGKAKLWASGKPDKYEAENARMFNYLGLKKEDIVNWYTNGKPETGEFWEQYKAATQIFVEDAVMTSDPAIRPMWHSDPRFKLLSQLKGFPTMMGNNFMKRWLMDASYALRTRDQPNNIGFSLFATAAVMTYISMLSLHLTDHISYGNSGNPRVKDDSLLIELIRAGDRVGFGGAISQVAEDLYFGQYSSTGYVGSVLGAPGVNTLDDAGHLAVGLATWDAKITANAIVPYEVAILKIFQSKGLNHADPITKKEVREWTSNFLEEYLGMEKLRNTGVRPPKP